MVAFYNAGDQAIYNQGYSFIPQERFRLGDPNLSAPTTTAPVTGGVVTALPNMGGGNDVRGYESFTPKFTRRGVFADPKEYGPGGMYEINPTALGFEFGPQGQVMRAGPKEYMQGQLGPSTLGDRLFGSSLDLGVNSIAGVPMREIADMYDERMQMEPNTGIGSKFRNFMKRFTGAQSNFEAARVPGMLEQMAGKIPSLTGILTALGGNRDRSDRSRFAVDNAGFGQGTGRDQFGVFTGGKTLFGKTANYTERMKNEIAEIAKNFGYSEDDLLGLDPAALAELGKRNKFRQTQVIDYVNKLRAKEIEAAAQKQIEAQKLKEQRARTREADAAAGAFSNQVQQDSGGGDGGGGSWKEQTAAKERQGVSVAGPGFGKGAYFMDGGLVDLVDIYD
tara:strand:- start:173 stop:1348 length:1176 start_codon:yes stop_codon:yes gene_type:complete